MYTDMDIDTIVIIEKALKYIDPKDLDSFLKDIDFDISDFIEDNKDNLYNNMISGLEPAIIHYIMDNRLIDDYIDFLLDCKIYDVISDSDINRINEIVISGCEDDTFDVYKILTSDLVYYSIDLNFDEYTDYINLENDYIVTSDSFLHKDTVKKLLLYYVKQENWVKHCNGEIYYRDPNSIRENLLSYPSSIYKNDMDFIQRDLHINVNENDKIKYFDENGNIPDNHDLMYFLKEKNFIV